MTANKEYDVAIVGGGPNGLICGAYLARAGLRVVILEARHETGGGLDTFEFAGFRFNPHAIYHMMADYMPPYKDLDLAARGVKYIYPEVQCAYVNQNAAPLLLYRDPGKTAEYLSTHFSAADGQTYQQMYADFREFSEAILMPLTYVPPMPAIDQTQALNAASGDLGRRFNKIAELTPLEILEQYEFSDPVKAGLLNLFLMWGMSPYEVGFLFPLYVYRMTCSALVAGGSHRLSSAIYRAFIEAGGEVLDRAEVVKVTLTNGKVSGLVTADGTEITATAVASTADPAQNFLTFFEPGEIPDGLTEAAQRWEWEQESLFGAHVALKQAPDYSGKGPEDDVNRALITFLGIHGTEQLLDHVEELQQGKLPEKPLGHVTCASLFDPLQAFPGHHTGRWECLAPYDADWETIKHEYAERCLDQWKAYAPNLETLFTLVYPPTYIEQKNKSMVRGSFKHGAYSPLQMGYLRPNDMCSSCYTPIEGFYVCGASTYPGGMILGGGGYIGANILAEDFGLDKPWQEPEYITTAREAGYIPD